MLRSAGPPLERPALWSEVRAAIATIERSGLRLAWQWVLSHGKSAGGWAPPECFSEVEVRDLSRHADEVASAELRVVAASSARVWWRCQADELVVWAAAALDFSAFVCGMYVRHLEALEDDLPLTQLTLR
jgi:hypothetical protein